MPKSKELIDSDDDFSSSEETKPKVKKQKVEKKTAVASDDDASSGEEEVKPKGKKQKVEKKTAESAPAKEAKKSAAKQDSDNENNTSTTGPDGTQMYSLAKMRYISVSEFKGKAFVNIREYYEASGKTLPGKKGISLSLDQWENLKKNMSKIDADIKKIK